MPTTGSNIEEINEGTPTALENVSNENATPVANATPSPASSSSELSPPVNYQEPVSPKISEEDEEIVDVELLKKKKEAEEAERKQKEEQETKEKKRIEVLREIQSTETSYVNNLLLLQKEFINPLKESIAASKPILNENDYQTFFMDLEVIINVNQELLGFIKDYLRRIGLLNDGTPPDPKAKYQTIGEIFIFMSNYLRSYNTYCNKYESIFKTIEERKAKSKAFRKFMEVTEYQPQVGFQSLTSFMITPVQRIPRYNMLLNELLKYTKPEHQDYANLKKASEAVQKVATFVNERLRENHNRERCVVVSKIVRGFTFELVQAQRKFVKEGRVCYISASRGLLDRYMFLFNDMILLVKPKVPKLFGPNNEATMYVEESKKETNNEEEKEAGDVKEEKKEYKKVFKLKTAISLLSLPLVNVIDIRDTVVIQNAFFLVCEKKTYTLFCHTPEEKADWLKEINKKSGDLQKNPLLQNKPNAALNISASSLVKQFVNLDLYVTPGLLKTASAASMGASSNKGVNEKGDAEAKERKKRSSLSKAKDYLQKKLATSKKSADGSKILYCSDSDEENDKMRVAKEEEVLATWQISIRKRLENHQRYLKTVALTSRHAEDCRPLVEELIKDEYETFVFNPLHVVKPRTKSEELMLQANGTTSTTETDDFAEFAKKFGGASGSGEAEESATTIGSSKEQKRKSKFLSFLASGF